MADPTVLMVEDNPADVFLMSEAVRHCGVAARVVVMADGEKAIGYVDRETNPPALIILDINLPKKTGIQVLEHVRATPHYRDVPVVVFTSSQSEPERSRLHALGVSAYLFKSLDLDEFNSIGSVVRQILLNRGPYGTGSVNQNVAP